jgi:hypothetical protein
VAFDTIPQELKDRRQWIVWKIIQKSGRDVKVPFQPNGITARTDDPSTWYSFEECLEVVDKYAGLGYVFSAGDPYCGIDFDSCFDLDKKEMSEWAKPWIVKLNSYSEVSPSGTGVKVWVKGKFPFGNGKNIKLRNQPSIKGKTAGVEVYDHGRYFCVTGKRVSKVSENPEPRQNELEELYKYYFEVDAPGKEPDLEKSSSASVIERARRYIDRIPGAISGEAGHNATFKTACVLIHGFNMGRAEAFVLISEWNKKCQPPWLEKELRHKIESADKQLGDRGYLLKTKEADWDSYQVPDYVEPSLLHLVVDNTGLTEEESERQAIQEEACHGRVHTFSLNEDGLYKLTVPEYVATLEIDRLRRESNELIGELCVRCNLPGVRSYDGALSVADFNLSSARARQERAKILATRTNFGAKEDWIDWLGLIEEFCQRVLVDERRGQSSFDLRDLERPDPQDTIKVAGIEIPRRHPTILFGDGGAAKSYIALYMAGLMAKSGVRVALFDWELCGEDHRERLERLFPDEMPLITYARCERALIHEVDRLRRIVRDGNIEYCFYDSIAFACSGPPESAEIAGAYFRAVRQIGGGSEHIAHVSKADGADQKPFGCYSSDTEVLTRDGWKYHCYVTLDDEVACFDMVNEILTWEHPTKIHRYPYNGKMIEMVGASISFLVTPNHNMVIKKPISSTRGGWSSIWRKFEASSIQGTTVKIPGATKFEVNPKNVEQISAPMARFIGWWIAEGCLNDGAPVLTQCEGILADKMKSTSSDLGFDFNVWVGKTAGRINEKPCMQMRLRGAIEFGKWLGSEAGIGAANKKIPKVVFEQSGDIRHEVLMAMMDGDGHWISDRSGTYTTISENLANDFQMLAIMDGWTARIRKEKGRFSILIGKRKSLQIRSSRHKNTVQYHGEVMCLTVPTGAYVTRREGYAGISGNSAFWHNGARATWYVKATQDPVNDSVLQIGLFNRKANLARVQKTIGLRIEFTEDRTYFTSCDPAETPDIAEHMSLTQRMRHALKRGPVLAEELSLIVGATTKRVNETAKRNTKLFVVDGGKIGNLFRG